MALLGSSFLPQQTILHVPTTLEPLERNCSLIIKCNRTRGKPPSGGSQNGRVVKIQSQRRAEFKQEFMFSCGCLKAAVEDDNKTQVLDAALSLMIN